jgi:hypothetical protein
MNQKLERRLNCAELASPSGIVCGQCQFQAICPAFWTWCAADRWPLQREPSARGTLHSVDSGVDGDLFSIFLQLDGSQGDRGPQPLALRKSIHGDLTGCTAGTVLRIVSARLRPDGRLRADISTCVCVERDLPEIEPVGSM